jgi:V/A-type H+/Na+-transporting ATPase subunit A
MEQKKGEIIKVSGPLVVAKNMDGSSIYEVVKISEKGLLGEIIEIRDDVASIQVYEETSGIGPGEPVERTGSQLSVELGPGLMSAIYDGIQRPLKELFKVSGDFITRGINVSPLDEEKKWNFVPKVKVGDKVVAGDVLGEVEEMSIYHKIMVPNDIEEGEVVSVEKGDFTIREVVVKVKTKEGRERKLTMTQKWPIRQSRPVAKKMVPSALLTTGQRVIDSFFPITKGGSGCVPGPFGSGKTVVLHQIAKWSDADIIIFIGCGERGNEMTDVLKEFPELKDPKTGRPLLERTVLIANTSNMPVAAREASVYTGITIAEYFRDMGYDVALMADSTSRWAEALREISARLEEMPGEEGYPAYLGSRTASFYERAGYVQCLGSEKREGSLTAIGSVSPPGGDLSEPVTQNTLRTVKVFWSLEDRLAYARHFPAINWLNSYSLYLDNLKDFYKEKGGVDFVKNREEAMRILNDESRLEEIVRLVGFESLSNKDRLIMETARIIREDFLMQNAFDDVDTYNSFKKQSKMLSMIINFYNKGLDLLGSGQSINDVLSLPEKAELAKAKFVPEKEIE